MGKTRDLFKKIRDTKGIFHAKMGTIKDRNGMGLTKAEDIKKRWQEYTELYKKDLHDPENHNGVIAHLEPDILECEVKWALGNITMNKASGGNGILGELFQILKDNGVKVLHSICQQIWKTQQRPQDWKGSVFIPIPKKGNAKEYSNYSTITLISHASKIMLKILWARLQQYVNCELPNVEAGFTKGRRTRDQIANICWIVKKAKKKKKSTSEKKKSTLRKKSISALLVVSKPLTVWITTNCGKFLKRWEYQTTWPASSEICMQVKKQQLELDMERQPGSKLEKEYIKAAYRQPAYLTYMQSTSWEMLGWMKHKLASRLPGEISITSDMQMTSPLWQKLKN